MFAVAPLSQAAAEIIWDLTGQPNGGNARTLTSDGRDLTAYAFSVVNDATVQSNPFAVATVQGGGNGLGVRHLNGNNLDNKGGDLDLFLFELPSDRTLPLELGFNRNDNGDRVRAYVGGGIDPSSFAGLSFDSLDGLVGSGDLSVDLAAQFGPDVTGRFLIVTIPVGGSSDEFRLASLTSQVPEPASAILFLFALGGLAVVRQKAKRSA